jgi:hypothetical protein
LPAAAGRAGRPAHASFVSGEAIFVVSLAEAPAATGGIGPNSRDLRTARRLRLKDAHPAKERKMTFKLGMREGAISAAVFGGVMFALVSVDARVRDHVSELVGNSASVAPLSSRFAELLDALWSAARYQSIENAPLLVFATVGAVLTVFMLRS